MVVTMENNIHLVLQEQLTKSSARPYAIKQISRGGDTRVNQGVGDGRWGDIGEYRGPLVGCKS